MASYVAAAFVVMARPAQGWRRTRLRTGQVKAARVQADGSILGEADALGHQRCAGRGSALGLDQREPGEGRAASTSGASAGRPLPLLVYCSNSQADRKGVKRKVHGEACNACAELSDLCGRSLTGSD